MWIFEDIGVVYLDRVPIYTIRDHTLKKKTAKLLLRWVIVKDGKLRLTLGTG